jgi:hypothetical protein
VLIGLQLYQAESAALRRQRLATEALGRLAGVEAVNLQYRGEEPFSMPGIETVPVLERDSLTVVGARGKRKPLASEMFDALAAIARARGHQQFAVINADIVVTAAAIGAIAETGAECCIVSRCDVDDLEHPSRAGLPMTSGLDMFVASAAWWISNRRRFRDYCLGEMCWDCVYAAIMMCHARSVILNRECLILHERHTPTWHDPTPAARYNGMLAALDSRYFSLWVGYWQKLEAARRKGVSDAEERELQRTAFVWRPSAYEAARQVVRSIRARRGYARLRSEWAAV